MRFATNVLVLVTIGLFGLGINLLFLNIDVYSQSLSNQSSLNSTGAGSQFIVNIRGISSSTEENLVALISTEDEVQAKKINLSKTLIKPGEEKMIDVAITMNKAVKPDTEVMACVLQLGIGDFSQRIKCNTVFSGDTAEPQKIIVPLFDNG